MSSTNLYLESCLYAKNTNNATIIKSIAVEIKSPYLNSVVEPDKLGILTERDFKSPVGRNSPISGLTISFTSAVTSLEAAHLIQMQ